MRRAVILAAVLLSGCAAPQGDDPSQDGVLKARVAELTRLGEVAFPILTANSDLCDRIGRKGVGTGFWVHNEHSWRGAWSGGGRRALHLDSTPTVFFVMPSSPSDVKRGDRVLSIDGVTIVPSDQATKQVDELINARSPAGAFDMVVDRAGSETTVRVSFVPICNYVLRVVGSTVPNAYITSSGVITVTSALMHLASDDELAFAVAHEIAHSLQRHLDARQGRAVAGTVLDIAVSVFIPTFGVLREAIVASGSPNEELEADAVGLTLIHRAGYSIGGGPSLIRKLNARRNGATPGWFASHPAPPERLVALERAVAELQGREKP